MLELAPAFRQLTDWAWNLEGNREAEKILWNLHSFGANSASQRDTRGAELPW